MIKFQTKILFLFLSINIIFSKEPIEFHLGETVEFDGFDNNYFMLNYDGNNNITVYLITQRTIKNIGITDPDQIFTHIYYESFLNEEMFVFNLYKKGKYLFNFIPTAIFPINDNSYFLGNKFSTFAVGQIIDTIDLTKNMYYNPLRIEAKTKLESSIYKVENLKKDTYVFFYFEYTPYDYEYPIKHFKICIVDSNECKEDVTIYKFLKDKKYNIYIYFSGLEPDFIPSDPDSEIPDPKFYFYYPFAFFPVLDYTFQVKKLGYYISLEPKIYFISFKNIENLYAFFENNEKTLIALTDEVITPENLDKLEQLEFEEIGQKFLYTFWDKSNYAIVISIPSFETFDYYAKISIVDSALDNSVNGEFTIPAGKSQLIYFEDRYCNYKENNPLEFYNFITTYSSEEKNMRFIYSDYPDEKYDFLLSEYSSAPLYIEKNSKDIKINFKILCPKYTFFSVLNSYLFSLYFSYFTRSYLKSNYESDQMKKVKEILPMNIRINTNLMEFYEFFNFYFHEFDEKINLYINKLYGETDLYECNETLKLNDLSILATPISKCKDKQSIFNRFFTLNGTKILSGYFSPNSYFDIYLEYNDNSENIKISKLFKDTINSASKYIKKDIEYTFDFDLDHMVKIQPGKNIEVTIYNDEDTIILNSEKASKNIVGKNFKIKSNGDTMIYLYGRIFQIIKYILIEPKRSKKNILVTSDTKLFFCIDTGFENYNPSNYELFKKSTLEINKKYYIENIYEKIKKKLVKGENLYLYYTSNILSDVNNARVTLDYIEDNLNNPNNDYNFNVIPKNSTDKSLIIQNRYIEEIIFNVNYCKKPVEVVIQYEDLESKEKKIILNENDTSLKLNIKEYGTKLKFESTEDFIFSYSFYDKTDNQFNQSDIWLAERKVLDKLNINEIKDKNSNDNVLLINFNPNYKNSNTKYIIVIAPEEGDNTENNFNNPCYLTKLVTDRPSGVKIENYFDVGDKNIITAEVDITDILNKNNKYIANIISQELRFEKKLNFYSPKTFFHEEKNNIIEDDNKYTVLIIVISIIGIVIIAVAIIIIINCIKNKNIEKKINKIEKLL